MKICLKCGLNKNLADFSEVFRDWRFPDGLSKVCKPCEKNRYQNQSIKSLLRTRFYNSLVKNNETARLFMNDFVGCSKEFFFNHMRSMFKPGMSWENYGKWHIDHKTPCAAFDLTILENQKACFHYSNLQPLWKTENFSKGRHITNEAGQKVEYNYYKKM